VITLDLKAAAALLRLHPDTLRDGAAKGKFPGAKPGKCWVFIEADLLAFLRGEYVKEKPCRSTSSRAVKSGGQTSAMPVAGYVAQLEQRIAAKRKSATTRSR
jgi:hypothetical protein